jgi:hypothetical protein
MQEKGIKSRVVKALPHVSRLYALEVLKGDERTILAELLLTAMDNKEAMEAVALSLREYAKRSNAANDAAMSAVLELLGNGNNVAV